MFLFKLVLVLNVVLFTPSGREEGAPTSSSSSQEQESVTMATASLGRRRRGGGGGRRTAVAGAPDLDLDLVEEEAEEERRKMRRRREEEEEMKSQAVREGRRSRSFPRDSLLPEESLRGRSHTVSHAKHHGSSAAAPQAAFSFLRPMSDDGPPSDSQLPANFLEVSQSAASMVPTERSDWRREPGSGQDLSRRLTQVLIGCSRSGRDLADGLSL